MNPDFLLPAAFLAGFFGSTHCLGMCGTIVVLFEHQTSMRLNLWLRRGFSNLGRLGFYALLGAIAGGAGAVIVATAGARIALLGLRVLAGLLVIVIGLNLVFDWRPMRFLERAGAGLWKRLSPLARHVLPIETPGHAIAAGFLWGALPCGLVYSAVAMAATTGSVAGGALTMFSFWLGTVPALVLAGASAQRLRQWRSKTPFRRAAGSIMIVIGVLSMAPFRMLIH